MTENKIRIRRLGEEPHSAKTLLKKEKAKGHEPAEGEDKKEKPDEEKSKKSKKDEKVEEGEVVE